jgi:autotransporter adhesin
MDNTGKGFVTGEVAKDYNEPINQLQENVSNNSVRIDNNTKQINDNTKLINSNARQINSVNNRVNGLSNQVSGLSDRVDLLDNRLNNLNSKMKQGFATVTALTSLHPNPRSNEKLEVSIGTGIYEDTFAGAIGLFYHPNDRVQIYAGAAYGGHESWAGGVGVTFGIGRKD